ncbi:SCAN domain-containing protein 3-like [Macrobrachium rosenbergii]|uniref:SCAN domain-containing protein 3-like n=1 Tax=Macrobrachium rosenbergii TaxID=79674 RepID=UPI0034D418B8
MSPDISDILSEILKHTKFALEAGESMDITGQAHLAFVRFDNEGKIMENFLCCKELPDMSLYLESCGLSWNQHAPSMTGSVKGFVSCVKEILKQVLDVTVNMVNFIKQRPLESRMFARLCENMQEDHVTLFT